MATFNQIILVGHIGHTPELRVSGQTSICNFTLAVDDRVKVNNEWTRQTDWFRCNVFGKAADSLANYLKKGSLVCVVGKMKSRKYVGRDNIERTAWEVNVSNIQMLDSKAEGGESQSNA